MAFDETLADRVRQILGTHPVLTERRMFGSLIFMLNRKMFVGVMGEDLMVRVGPASQAAALKRPHVRPLSFSGRPTRGYVLVSPEGTTTVDALAFWLERGAEFVESLPEPPPKKARRGRG